MSPGQALGSLKAGAETVPGAKFTLATDGEGEAQAEEAAVECQT